MIVCRSDLESVNNELNERLTSLSADNELLRTQLNDASAALARVMSTAIISTTTIISNVATTATDHAI